MAAGLANIDRLIQLLTASPQYSAVAAERLANYAKDLPSKDASSSGEAETKGSIQQGRRSKQIDLLWRISGYLFRKRWEIRVAAALALEKVGLVMEISDLAYCLFGTLDLTAKDHPGGAAGIGGLLRLETLDMELVLRDGEPLVASTGEEYRTEGGQSSISREELERQKLEIIKRLGLEMTDADARRALEIGSGGANAVAGFGINDEDLVTDGDSNDRKKGSSTSSSSSTRRKRKLEGLGLTSSSHVTAGGGEAARKDKQQDQAIAATGEATAAAVAPWLAEHLSVRLFDAAWESRHGATLGLIALFKAWRERIRLSSSHLEKGEGGEMMMMIDGQEQGPWLRQWAEDVAGRCICLLGLDRFGDYSLGSAVAPVREVAGQLFALVLASWTNDTLVEQAFHRLRILTTEDAVWEVRHGAFVGLKYLVAVPNEFVRRSSSALLEIGCQGLGDNMDDVREAASTSVLSVLLCRPPPSNPSKLGCESILSPIFSLLSLNEAGPDATAVYLPSFLRLTSHALDAILASPSPSVALPMTFWASAVDKNSRSPKRRETKKVEPVSSSSSSHALPHAGVLLERLWSLGMGSEPSTRGPALRALARLFQYWATTTSKCHHIHVYERREESAWKLLKALAVVPPSSGAEMVQDLSAVWEAFVTLLEPSLITNLGPAICDDWFVTSSQDPSSLVRLYCTILSPVSDREEWGARRRTASAIALLDWNCIMSSRALEVVRGSSSSLIVKEAGSLLLGSCMGKKDKGKQEEQMMKEAKETLLAGIEDGLSQTTTAGGVPGRRLAASAAAALVRGGVEIDKPGVLIRALMESIKAEEDKERLDMAVEGIIGLTTCLIEGNRAKKALEKLIGNLCLLACATQDQAAASARTSSRDVLKGLVGRLGAEAFVKLPVFWERIGPPISGEATVAASEGGEGTVVEDGIRLLMVITPVLQGEALAAARGLIKALVHRATSDNNGKEGEVNNSRLVNLLAARCLTNIIKRGEIPSIAAELSPLLAATLRDYDHEEHRWRAAHCLLEVAKALKTMSPSEVKRGLPHLLPVTLATVADYSPEVREPGSEAFCLLVESAPLLDDEDWKDQGTRKKAADQQANTVDDIARQSVMKLVLGQSVGGEKESTIPLPASLPSMLKGGLVLRPYQWEGVKWLTFLRHAGLHGALCDEMGLGKTVQALMSLAIAHCESSTVGQAAAAATAPSLVLCPASLSGHWFYEARRFFAPEAIETKQYRPGLSKREKDGLIKGAKKHHLIVASYDMLRRDAGLLTSRTWDHLILDEVHVLRGVESSALGRAVRKLKAAHRIALTGTPLQNQVHDVWGVFDVLMPGLLGNRKHFEKEFGRPIGRATLRSAEADATAEALAKLDRLHAHLLPFILRREKGRVLQDLPPKTVTDLACELVPLQREMYDGHCQTEQARDVVEGLRTLVSSNASMTGSREGVQEQLGTKTLRLLHYLRLLCVHPALVLDSKTPQAALARESLMSEVDCSGKMVALQNLLFACGVVTEYREPFNEDEEDNGGQEADVDEQEDEVGQAKEEEEEEEEKGDVDKGQQMEADEEEVEESADRGATGKSNGPSSSGLTKDNVDDNTAAAGSSSAAAAAEKMGLHRCLIFAQHRDTLDAIERSVLRRAHWNEGYTELASSSLPPTRFLRLDGSIPSLQREAVVQRFNADPSIPLMLLTTRVGGLGLNLTGADVIIFVEHDWNPAVDLQAMDRAHRIGQRRPVNVYRLVTRDTVEEQVMALQRRKRGLAEAVVTESNAVVGESRMLGVLDLVAASTGASSFTTAGGESSSNIVFGPFEGLAAAAAAGGGGGNGGGQTIMTPSEEPWSEEQYSSFAVEAFLSNVLGK